MKIDKIYTFLMMNAKDITTNFINLIMRFKKDNT